MIQSAIKFGQDYDVPEIKQGMTYLEGFKASAYGMAIQHDPSTKLKAYENQIEYRKQLIDMVSENADAIDPKLLSDLLDLERGTIDDVLKMMARKEIEYVDGADLLNNMFENWETLVNGNGGVIDRAYKSAFSVGSDISWNISDVIEEGRKHVDGILIRLQ
jgi:hypothetical protein